jgi:quercetin dioxygenase-like cupin family protein
LFAFADGEGLSEHTAPFDALVLVLDGALALTIGGQPVEAGPGTIRAHAGRDPHAVDATAGLSNAVDHAQGSAGALNTVSPEQTVRTKD